MVNDNKEINMGIQIEIVVLISANAEWSAVSNYFSECNLLSSPYGEWFEHKYKDIAELVTPLLFLHGGWGKVAAAASTQYVIDCWHPKIIMNLGTCGGFEGEILKGEIILADKTIIYDIYEQMGDPDEHINHYITEIDNSWISKPYPLPVKQLLLASADRDLFSTELYYLKDKYGAIVGDWESGAIAWVSKINHTRCMILRGVTDLVGVNGGEAYSSNLSLFTENAEEIMNILMDSLPKWIKKYYENTKS
jgi:adenosylhomocysteine nucleosidase